MKKFFEKLLYNKAVQDTISVLLATLTLCVFTSHGSRRASEGAKNQQINTVAYEHYDLPDTKALEKEVVINEYKVDNVTKMAPAKLEILEEFSTEPLPTQDVITEEHAQSYDVVESTNESSGNFAMFDESDLVVNYILTKYNINLFQFKVILSTVYYETAANNYEDAYAVINTIYNRTISKRWVNYIEAITPYEGENLYSQVVAPTQFSGYMSKTAGYDFDSLLNIVSYDGQRPFEIVIQAVTDFLLNAELNNGRMHNYLSFKANNLIVPDGVRFTSDGNVYHDLLTEDDLISDDYSLVEDESIGKVLTKKR